MAKENKDKIVFKYKINCNLFYINYMYVVNDC